MLSIDASSDNKAKKSRLVNGVAAGLGIVAAIVVSTAWGLLIRRRDGAVVSDLATDGSGGAALQTAIFEVTALVTVLKAQIADKAMNAITQYISS